MRRFIQVVAALVAIGTLIIVAQQASYTAHQTRILQASYEASYRPYLSVENITVQEGSTEFFKIAFEVTNRGESPATKLNVESTFVGGEDVRFDEITDIYTITVTSEGPYLVDLRGPGLPSDLMMYPGERYTMSIAAHKPTFNETVARTGIMHIGIPYSWGDKEYVCMAVALKQPDGSWVVAYHRGY